MLQVVLLSTVHWAGGNIEIGQRWIAFASVLGTVLLIVAIAHRHLGRAVHPWVAIVIGLYLSDEYTAVHTMSGMETQLFVFLMCAVTSLSLRFVDTRSESASIVLGATMFLSVLCRPEAVVYAAGTIIGLRLATTNTVRELLADCKRESVLCPAVFVSLLAGYGAWKFYYFGYLLPNSFYLKSVGVSLLPGLPFVLGFFEHVGFWMGLFGLVPFLLVCRQVPQFLADREVRAKIILVCLPPILAWLYYCTIVHEVGFASRFSYPTYFYLTIGGTALVHIARQRSLASQSYRVGYEWFAAGVVIVVVVLRVMFPGPWSVQRETTWRLENLGPDAWGVYHTRIARALQASQLEEDATVITGAAGLIPYVSRMRHVDPVGLTDNRLSGRYPLTAESTKNISGVRTPTYTSDGNLQRRTQRCHLTTNL